MKRTDWRDYNWQLIHEDPQHPSLHIALDETLADAVAAGQRPPLLRFWEWDSPCVAIGRFQSLKNEIDMANAKRYGVDIMRRISGGGAMFMESGNCITYSLYVPEAMVKGMSFQQSYAYLDEWVLKALAKVGIKAWYKPLNDITSDKGKIAGAAQARRRGIVVHHTTMAYNIDAEKMVQVLRIGREKMSDKGTTSAKKRVDPLRSQTGLDRQTIIQTMIATFREEHGLADSHLSAEEIQEAKRRYSDKFATPEWIGLVP